MSYIVCYYIEFEDYAKAGDFEAKLIENSTPYLNATCYEQEFIARNLTLEGIEADYEGK